MSANQGQWRCRTLGMELGPMPWSDLLELARQGELTPTDGVQSVEAKLWTPAHSIAELAAAFQETRALAPRTALFPTGPLEASSASVAAAHPTAIVATASDPTTEMEIARAITAASAGTTQRKSTEEEQRWFCRVGGAHYGPIRFSNLLQIVGHRRFNLSPDDYVRHGSQGKWVRVQLVPDLMRAAGHYSPPAAPKPSAWQSAVSLTRYRLRSSIHIVSDRIPSLPAARLPGWLRTVFQVAANGFRFLGAYSLIIVPAVIWISFNVLVVGFPEAAEELREIAIAAIVSPITWFVVLSIAAYVAAIWLKVRG